MGQALGEAEQARRVERWAALDDAAARARAVAGLPQETLRRVEDLRTTHHILSIQRARRPCQHLPVYAFITKLHAADLRCFGVAGTGLPGPV